MDFRQDDPISIYNVVHNASCTLWLIGIKSGRPA